jgi:hypothetical protein
MTKNTHVIGMGRSKKALKRKEEVFLKVVLNDPMERNQP